MSNERSLRWSACGFSADGWRFSSLLNSRFNFMWCVPASLRQFFFYSSLPFGTVVCVPQTLSYLKGDQFTELKVPFLENKEIFKNRFPLKSVYSSSELVCYILPTLTICPLIHYVQYVFCGPQVGKHCISSHLNVWQ